MQRFNWVSHEDMVVDTVGRSDVLIRVARQRVSVSGVVARILR
jgi:hypothetical protein